MNSVSMIDYMSEIVPCLKMKLGEKILVQLLGFSDGR